MLESPESRGGSESFVNWLTPILAKWYWKGTGYQIVVKDLVCTLPRNMTNG
jgi:hypothetical protein